MFSHLYCNAIKPCLINSLICFNSLLLSWVPNNLFKLLKKLESFISISISLLNNSLIFILLFPFLSYGLNQSHHHHEKENYPLDWYI